MQRISTLDDIAAALDALVGIDPRLEKVRAIAGDVPLRLSEPGFASLVSIIVSQQVSRASADAIFGRLSLLASPLTPQALLAGGEALYREAGLSRPKQRTLLALSEAVAGGFDLHRLCSIEAEPGHGRVDRHPGHRSVDGGGLPAVCRRPPRHLPGARRRAAERRRPCARHRPRPGEKQLIRLAESWAPHRGVASRLFWAYYRETKGMEGAPPS